MKQLIVNTIAEGHERAIAEILKDNIEVMTKHGMTIEHSDGLDIKILNPFMNPIKSPLYKFSLVGMADYAFQCVSVLPKKGNNQDFDYNVGNRWLDYFSVEPIDVSSIGATLVGDGDNQGFNQIEVTIKELQKDITSRRAMICSLYPPVDAEKKHIPCITQLQFLVRNNRLNLIVYIRSNDMLSAWGADAYALSGILKLVSERLNIAPGYLEILSVSAHIYYERDQPELLNFRRKLNI